jgi:proline iminopeptidase
VANADRLRGIRGWLIHGRFDLGSPIDGPWRLHQGWLGSELIVVEQEGHGGDTISAHARRVLADL